MNLIESLKEQVSSLDERTRLRLLILAALLMAVAVCYSLLLDRLDRLAKRRVARETALVEMMSLKHRYREAKSSSQRLANRMAALKADDTPARIIDETGIKGKNTQVRSLPAPDGKKEDIAEVRMDGLTPNEAVNLLYRLEKGAKPVTIQKSLLKTRFDDPAKLDLVLTIAVAKPLPAGEQR